MHRIPRLAKAVAPLVVGGLIGMLLTGCVPGTGRNSWPTDSPTPQQSGATQSNPTASTPATTAGTASPSKAVTVAADAIKPLPDYAGPQPLPAADGKPMLWPVATNVSMDDIYDDYQVTVSRYGFLDVTGRLVIPQRYERYQYCPDDSGRPVLLILTRDTQARSEVFDLTGKRLATLPTNDASCAGPSYVITTRDGLNEASTQADVQNGLFELATGKLIMAMVKGRQLTSLRPGLLNVTERKGEYFLDLDSGRKTPHPGWISDWSSLAPGAPGLRATTKREAGKTGFLDLSGTWIIQPTLFDARPFAGGLAVVEPKKGTFALIDARLQTLAGEWTQLDEVYRTVGAADGSQTVGYLVTSSAGQALLDSAGKVVVPLGTGSIECSHEGTGTCFVRLTTGESRMVALPEGTTTELPAGFDQALSIGFLGSSERRDDGLGTVYSLASGKTIETTGRSDCIAVGTAYLDCEPDSEVLPHTVIDADGPTAFASVVPLVEPDNSGVVAYYQVTTGRYEGIVDAHGSWCFRQSRFTRLDE